MIDDESSFLDPVRRISSAAAPYPNDAARPAGENSQTPFNVEYEMGNINLRNETIFLFVKMGLWMISGHERFVMQQVLAT